MIEYKEVEAISIDGTINFGKNKISTLDFFSEFVEWLEFNNWYFMGGTSEVDLNNSDKRV